MVSENKELIWHKLYVIYFIFWGFTYTNSYSSKKDKLTKFYVTSSYISTNLYFTHTNQYEVEEKSTIYVRFSLINHWFNIKEVTMDIKDNYVSNFVLFQMVWFLKQRRNICQTFHVIFSTLMSCCFYIILFINEE